MIEQKCVATKEIKPINELFRVVRLKDSTILVEKNEKLFGRGAYVSKDKKIIELAKAKKSLSKALRCKVNDNVYDELLSLL